MTRQNENIVIGVMKASCRNPGARESAMGCAQRIFEVDGCGGFGSSEDSF